MSRFIATAAIVTAMVCALGAASLTARADPPESSAPDSIPAPPPPAAQLIKPHPRKAEPKPADHARSRAGPIDERCKPLRQELEQALQRGANPHKLFQAKLAHNAGTRLCRMGQPEKGMAEFRKGLSYLADKHRR